jgi:hypothetical protein
MAKISTKNLSKLPDIETLKRLCKSLATLDAIICREWAYRYYSFDKNWDTAKGEAYFEMKNGEGDEFQILFCKDGCVINGQAHESAMCNWKEIEVEPKMFSDKLSNLFGKKKTEQVQTIWQGVVDNLPTAFHDFIFTEPIKSKGTTFCIWRLNTDTKWYIGDIAFPKDEYGDGSENLLYILDNDPETYRDWATEYYEETFENKALSLEIVKQIYGHKPITKSILKQLNPELDNIQELKNDLDEIGYEYMW